MALANWTNQQVIDQLDSGSKWTSPVITYTFPTSAAGMYGGAAYSTPIPPPIPVQTLPAIPDETRHPLHSKPYRPFQSKVGHPFQNKPATQAG